VLQYCYNVIFEQALPDGINTLLLLGAVLVLFVPPSLLVYDRVRRKGVGK
jgi:hypothetical protein